MQHLFILMFLYNKLLHYKVVNEHIIYVTRSIEVDVQKMKTVETKTLNRISYAERNLELYNCYLTQKNSDITFEAWKIIFQVEAC